jgi:hypothetical protein
MDKVKPLVCKNKHRVGEIRWNGDDVPLIMIYREAVDGETVVLENAMIGPVIGQAEFVCSICKQKRVWGVSIETALYLIDTMPFAMRFDFWGKLMHRAKVAEVRDVKVDV